MVVVDFWAIQNPARLPDLMYCKMAESPRHWDEQLKANVDWTAPAETRRFDRVGKMRERVDIPPKHQPCPIPGRIPVCAHD